MGIPLKLVAKDILVAGCKQLPLVGAAVEVVDNIAKSHETLHMRERLHEIESSMTSFERRMRDLVKAEIEQTVQGLSQRDLSGSDFTNHIKNLYDIRQNGWSPALFQGLLERSVHWNELCQNPAHYGSVLSDRQELDSSKLQVFIDADKTRILELTPFALHGLLARQHDDAARAKIVTSADVWAFVDGLTENQGNKPNPLPTKSDSPRAGELIAVSLSGNITMKFAWCPPGTFLMGSPPSEEGRSDDETQHRVTLTSGFYLGIHPVTQAQWQAVIGNNPSDFKGGDRPVELVSWNECQAFCAKLSQFTGKRFRLPTEAEWEYACRAGTATPFYFGDTINTDQANYDGNSTYGQGKKGVYRRQTTTVASFPANPWGLFDMHGNVWEWCQDCYGPYPKGDMQDKEHSNRGGARALRGGTWNNNPSRCRSATRYRMGPTSRFHNLGFRIVLCLD